MKTTINKPTENNPGCTPRNLGFSQVCIWPATTLGNGSPDDFEKFILDEFATRAQFLEIITTSSGGVPGDGGRTDLFFAVHGNDIPKFATKRLAYGIRWIEDALAPLNYRHRIYPDRVREYKTWDANEA